MTSNLDYEITENCQNFICLPVLTQPVVLDLILLEDVFTVNGLIQEKPSLELDYSMVGSLLP